ncbi:Hypothetical protein R9X50_00720000 [Acrodontium crateriforme]|uniref:Protein-lysine N-methyltransferase EFM5 n=1 Tax=Acrodontium crateriforme TaxID=150365 RepID=A0AAQ3R7F0_9PEZI|nr:Hypothetical protein R9X50_00720000 [Acrodontium crateriforme]
MDSDDDVLQLPADTLKALEEFNSERDARAKHFEDLKVQSESDFRNASGQLSMELFGEDWNQSQFWYTDDTAQKLARQLFDGAGPGDSIAVVSAPSVYIQLRNLLSTVPQSSQPSICLMEFDKRFEVFGDEFVFYDFASPLRLPSDFKGKFDRIICDPPFLSQDCQTKTALTVRYLAKEWSPKLHFISCTGERMEETITRIYSTLGVRTTTFEPQHSKGLSNEFRCYSNFECNDWRWR